VFWSGLDELSRMELIVLVREQAEVIAELRTANRALKERVRRVGSKVDYLR
jgi:hypothetical protein